MLSKFSPRVVVFTVVSFIVAGGLAIGVELIKSYLFEIRNSIAALEEAKASNKGADALTLDAINTLKGTLETAAVANRVGKLQADATIIAANRVAEAATTAARTAGDSLVDASTITNHPDNEMYDSFTGPLFGEPSKRIQSLNEQIVRLKREAEKGIDHKTLRTLSDSERATRLAQKQVLEEELETLKETTSKNLSDSLGMLMGGASGGLLGTLGNFYPGRSSPAPRSNSIIIQEP